MKNQKLEREKRREKILKCRPAEIECPTLEQSKAPQYIDDE
jgi:hypothetical protein